MRTKVIGDISKVIAAGSYIANPMGKLIVYRGLHPRQSFHLPACVARPVGKAEIEAKKPDGKFANQGAQDARKAEWTRLWERGVWDVDYIRDWDDIARESRRTGKEVHMGRLFGIMVEKALN